MSEQTEAKLFTNLETLVNGATILGAAYKPPNPYAATAVMQTNLDNAESLRAAWLQKAEIEEDARNDRENLFKTVAPLFSEIINYGKAAGWDKNTLDNLRSMKRELTGVPAEPKKKDDPNTPEDESAGQKSSAQTSYANRAVTAAQFVEGVRTQSGYKPDEERFKLASLDALIDSLNAANSSVATAAAATLAARTALDAVLYTDAANLVDAGNAAKTYLKAAFSKHPVYQSVKNFRFRKPARFQ